MFTSGLAYVPTTNHYQVMCPLSRMFDAMVFLFHDTCHLEVSDVTGHSMLFSRDGKVHSCVACMAGLDSAAVGLCLFELFLGVNTMLDLCRSICWPDHMDGGRTDGFVGLPGHEGFRSLILAW
jgi:hypothetical protein